MKVYHGTLKENAKSIFSQKIIRTTNEKNTQYSTEGYAKTTYGFVYVSKSLNEALGFALLATENKIDKQEVAVFQIDIRDHISLFSGHAFHQMQPMSGKPLQS